MLTNPKIDFDSCGCSHCVIHVSLSHSCLKERRQLTDSRSLVLWEFCLRHPEVRDVCDIGQMLFWGKKWAWYATAVMFLLNNTVCPHEL